MTFRASAPRQSKSLPLWGGQKNSLIYPPPPDIGVRLLLAVSRRFSVNSPFAGSGHLVRNKLCWDAKKRSETFKTKESRAGLVRVPLFSISPLVDRKIFKDDYYPSGYFPPPGTIS